jgi:hypothetical protein
MNGLRSSLEPIPNSVALFPCVIDVERSAVSKYDAFTNGFTGLCGFRRTLRDERRTREEQYKQCQSSTKLAIDHYCSSALSRKQINSSANGARYDSQGQARSASPLVAKD